jgi:hypothetical protein
VQEVGVHVERYRHALRRRGGGLKFGLERRRIFFFHGWLQCKELPPKNREKSNI